VTRCKTGELLVRITWATAVVAHRRRCRLAKRRCGRVGQPASQPASDLATIVHGHARTHVHTQFTRASARPPVLPPRWLVFVYMKQRLKRARTIESLLIACERWRPASTHRRRRLLCTPWPPSGT